MNTFKEKKSLCSCKNPIAVLVLDNLSIQHFLELVKTFFFFLNSPHTCWNDLSQSPLIWLKKPHGQGKEDSASLTKCSLGGVYLFQKIKDRKCFRNTENLNILAQEQGSNMQQQALHQFRLHATASSSKSVWASEKSQLIPPSCQQRSWDASKCTRS